MVLEWYYYIEFFFFFVLVVKYLFPVTNQLKVNNNKINKKQCTQKCYSIHLICIYNYLFIILVRYTSYVLIVYGSINVFNQKSLSLVEITYYFVFTINCHAICVQCFSIDIDEWQNDDTNILYWYAKNLILS